MEHSVHPAVVVDELCPGPAPTALARPLGRTAHQALTAGTPGRLSASHVLAALPSAAGCARRFLRAQLRQWRLDELVGSAELAVSELVTHALASTGVPAPASYGDLYNAALNKIAVRLHSDGHAVIIEVWDSDATPPDTPGEPEKWEEGWPLGVVNSISRRWGYRTEAGGKAIWCEITQNLAVPGRAQPNRETGRARPATAGGSR